MNNRCLLPALVLSVASLAFAMPSHAQTTWYVDDDSCPGPGSGTEEDPFCTIQDGIENAVDGDTVQVADGFYDGDGNQYLDFLGKAILLMSENGPENCVIDCSGPTPAGVIFQNGEGLDSVLRGFTIQGVWYTTDLGAIRCIDSSPKIEENIVQGNWSELQGGGIYCLNSNPSIRSNTIQDNVSWWGAGGAIYCDSSSPSICDNIISNNSSDLGGGAGIYCENSSSPEIINNKITENYCNTWGSGAGIYCAGGSPLIMYNEIDGNDTLGSDSKSGGDGGGIYCGGSSAKIISNLITNNNAGNINDSGYGGGIAVWGGSPTIINNLIAGNTLSDWPRTMGERAVDGYGGGIFCGADSSAVIRNNTIVDNYENGNITVYGGGIYCDSSSAVIENCIVWDNSPTGIEGCDGLVTYSDVQGGYEGEGNINADPLFTEGPLGNFYLSQIASGQTVDSLCVDSGSDLAANICFDTMEGTTCLDQLTTRTDQVMDEGQVDMGYHYALLDTVTADLSCVPDSGVLPFASLITLTLTNQYTGRTRQIAGHLDVSLAGGNDFPDWRTGHWYVAPGQSHVRGWNHIIPNFDSLVGDSVLTLVAEDVTQAPWNQPPYPPSGDTDTASCTVTGIAP